MSIAQVTPWHELTAKAREQFARLRLRDPAPRAERLSGAHNPWGVAAAWIDAWLLLDICQHPCVLDGVQARLGPDLILWDSQVHLCASDYRRFVAEDREGRYGPVDPAAGVVALVQSDAGPWVLARDGRSEAGVDVWAELAMDEPLYVIRYMPASSRFVRDPAFGPNWLTMEEQPLVNYTRRPLWLVRGSDRAANDFVTGFNPAVPRWAGRSTLET